MMKNHAKGGVRSAGGAAVFALALACGLLISTLSIDSRASDLLPSARDPLLAVPQASARRVHVPAPTAAALQESDTAAGAVIQTALTETALPTAGIDTELPDTGPRLQASEVAIAERQESGIGRSDTEMQAIVDAAVEDAYAQIPLKDIVDAAVKEAYAQIPLKDIVDAAVKEAYAQIPLQDIVRTSVARAWEEIRASQNHSQTATDSRLLT